VPAKQDCPELEPLLVDVTSSALEWQSRGEQNDIAKVNQIRNKSFGSLKRKVLGHFHTDREIEPPAEINAPAQVDSAEMRYINEEATPVNVVAIKAEEVFDAE
jgi:hypothetical protein